MDNAREDSSSPDVVVRTFLISDIRGYSTFRRERGDETAARLAMRFADLAVDAVEARDGTVLGLRGDEVLAVFDSTPQAIRAALEFQETSRTRFDGRQTWTRGSAPHARSPGGTSHQPSGATSCPNAHTGTSARSRVVGRAGPSDRDVPREEQTLAANMDIVGVAMENSFFRRVVETGEHSQVVVMSIPPGGEIGEETHDHVDQVLVFVAGDGEAILEGEGTPIQSGRLVFVPAGTKHNFVNTGAGDLKLYTVYAPPEHAAGTVHETKADADAEEH